MSPIGSSSRVWVSRCTWVSGTHSSSSIRSKSPDVLDAAGREQVVEDRLVAAEALEAHDLLDQERRGAVGVRVAVLDVALGRDAAQAVVAHQSLLSVGLRTRPTNSSVPVGACSTAQVKGRSKMMWKGSVAQRDHAHGHRGRGRGRRAALVDVDAGALQDAAQGLLARSADEVARGRARARTPARGRARSAPRPGPATRSWRSAAARRCRAPCDQPTRGARRPASPRSAGRCRGTAAGSRPRRGRSGPRRASSAPRRRPRTARRAASENGCAHLASRYSASVSTNCSSVAQLVDDARDHPVRLLVRPGVDAIEVERAGVEPASAGPGV